MRRLINMHYLDVRGTNLSMMPKGMGELKDLRMLTDFVLGGKKNGSSINELGKLEHLCGRLAISGLENVVSAWDAKDADLKDKKMLKELELIWSTQDDDNSMHDREVLEQLEPHPNVESFVIRFYGGTRFPGWVGSSSLSNVASVELSDCKYCFFLPPLGQLSSLKSLSIKGFAGVVTVGDEFYGHSCSKPFGCLKILRFEDMAEWEEWFCWGDEAFCVLQELCIRNCPKLTISLPKHLPSLTKLVIENCVNLGAFLPKAPSICELELRGCDALQMEEPLPRWLRRLGLYICSNINESILEKMLQYCTCLEKLSIRGCYDLRSLPEGSLPITLKQLEIKRCDMLDYSRMLSYTSLESLEIGEGWCDIPLQCFPLGSFPWLNHIWIYECQDLKWVGASHRQQQQQQHLVSLNSLKLCFCPNLICFQIEAGLCATNLTSFWLFFCVNLKSLLERMRTVFPSLEYLSIFNCPSIESFPEEGLPSKLKCIDIGGSDKLVGSMLRMRNNGWSLQALPSLTRFSIVSLKLDIECFPPEHLLSSSLTCLCRWDLPNLKLLDDKAFQQLTSLRHLNIESCPTLQSLPEKRLLTSLSSLRLQNCPFLEQGCEKEVGKDWHNISHIPVIEFDDQIII